MCKKVQKPELEPESCYENTKFRSRGCTHEIKDFRSWSHVYRKKSTGAGAVPFLRRLRSPAVKNDVLCLSVACSKAEAIVYSDKNFKIKAANSESFRQQLFERNW